MADDGMTQGEIARTFKRQDDAIRATNDRVADLARESVSAKAYEVAHQAVIDRVIHLEQDTLERLGRIEALAGERHTAISREIRDLKALVKAEVDDVRKELEHDRDEKRSRRDQSSTRLIAWIAALAAVALVVVTVLNSGGH